MRLASSSSTTSTSPREPRARAEEDSFWIKVSVCILAGGLRCGELRVGSGDKSGHFGRESSGVNGLGQVAVAARAQREGFVSPHRVGGESDDGQVMGGRILPQSTSGSQAVQTGQAEVHENEVRRQLAGGADAFFGGAGGADDKASGLKQISDQLHVQWIVFNDQDLHFHRFTPGTLLPRGSRPGVRVSSADLPARPWK